MSHQVHLFDVLNFNLMIICKSIKLINHVYIYKYLNNYNKMLKNMVQANKSAPETRTQYYSVVKC